jgi:hypothetical protein
MDPMPHRDFVKRITTFGFILLQCGTKWVATCGELSAGFIGTLAPSGHHRLIVLPIDET